MKSESDAQRLLRKVAAILQGCDLESDYYLDSRHPPQRLIKQKMIDWLEEVEPVLRPQNRRKRDVSRDEPRPSPPLGSNSFCSMCGDTGRIDRLHQCAHCSEHEPTRHREPATHFDAFVAGATTESWISVDDELPPLEVHFDVPSPVDATKRENYSSSCNVLVAIWDEDQDRSYVDTAVYCPRDGGWQLDAPWVKVTDWQPLPKPPARKQ